MHIINALAGLGHSLYAQACRIGAGGCGNRRKRWQAKFDRSGLDATPEMEPAENSIQRLMAEKKYKVDARQLLALAVRSKKLIPLPCEWPDDDHEGRIEAHHTDYSRPYDVIWLCRGHHRDLHSIQPYVAPLPEYTEQTPKGIVSK